MIQIFVFQIRNNNCHLDVLDEIRKISEENLTSIGYLTHCNELPSYSHIHRNITIISAKCDYWDNFDDKYHYKRLMLHPDDYIKDLFNDDEYKNISHILYSFKGIVFDDITAKLEAYNFTLIKEFQSKPFLGDYDHFYIYERKKENIFGFKLGKIK